MFQFWYRFIPANMSLIAQGAKDLVYRRIEKQIPAYMGFVFEDICKQYLWQQNLKGNLPIIFTDLGRWWGSDPVVKRQVEIDIIADNEEGQVIFGECKWRNELVGESELKELLAKKDLFHYRENWFMLFSKSGFTSGCEKMAEKQGNVVLVKYDDMQWHE